MGKGTKIQLQLAHLDGDERLNAYRVLLIAVAQLATRQLDEKEDVPDKFMALIRSRIETAFDTALNTGAFDKAGVFAHALDDVCVDFTLFGITPHSKTEHAL
jgi:hypothetical protein